LTLNPLTLGAQPIRWRRGDVRRSADRATWAGFAPSNDPLLTRADEYLGSRSLETRSRRLIDLRTVTTPSGSMKAPGRGPGELQSRQLPNRLSRSAHAGRIVSVR
jgi:hypothetical protein